ncbi:MAG: hypothetical protein M1827_007319 [Pycnora praestabilis]|nr:MAG: hypothetical protein M1827_007319 [Pycnora praestabilis]
MAPKLPVRAGRPLLRHGSATGGSYLQDVQEYRPHHHEQGIDSIVENNVSPNENSSEVFQQAHINLSPSTPSRIKDSGIVHTMSHHNCQPGPDDSQKIVATIFYKSQNPRHPHIHPDSSNASSLDQLPEPSLSVGAAPTVDMENYPLEPPPPEPEPLDHLYGPYISQICLTYFLKILEDLQQPYRRITSSHRCLDSQTHPRVMEITFSPPPNPEYLTFEEMRKHESIWLFEREWNVEVVFQRENVFRKHKRLAVFDMDSTLIQHEVIDEIARIVGVEKEVSAITARAMNGELDFTDSLQARVALLKGVPADVFEKLKSVIKITLGARDLCMVLKRLGFKTAVLSGGFMPLTGWLARELGIDYAFANNLVSDPTTSTLTGALEGPIVDATRKANLLASIASENGIPLRQVFAVGDGANDLPMMKKAGLGVAFNAKPMVQLDAPSRLNSESLLDILYILGFTSEEQKALLAG